MKKLLLLLALSGCVAAGHAQEILLGTDFKMYFDNKEFGSNEFAVPGLDIESGTDFAARLTPRVGIRWDEKNTLVIAADRNRPIFRRSNPSSTTSSRRPR